MNKNKYLYTFVALLALYGSAQAQQWSPSKNVEIVVGSAPGGSNDRTGRSVEKLLNELKLVPTSLTVVNKPGGGGNIMFSYVKTELERNYWSDDFVTSTQFRKDLDKDYADMKSVLVDLGLAKQ